ncbi:hypothetical protein BCR33DRAFT_376874 [Rhizoclosmatium globosum]|uniref:Secreted protein n=1 Tax=Rhizoclosmatium globosum TaxID=329046 RepID=A0A1Y2BYK5_9FUNG|nr:hypothetical protein BCR33DRAFT_376874 [Rhizoclosmatium globosum]|eukprot:ORY39853.1 hypothetical protein BCR33DRAFT_376874 [Rhizoclosmatium globosum]
MLVVVLLVSLVVLFEVLRIASISELISLLIEQLRNVSNSAMACDAVNEVILFLFLLKSRRVVEEEDKSVRELAPSLSSHSNARTRNQSQCRCVHLGDSFSQFKGKDKGKGTVKVQIESQTEQAPGHRLLASSQLVSTFDG